MRYFFAITILIPGLVLAAEITELQSVQLGLPQYVQNLEINDMAYSLYREELYPFKILSTEEDASIAKSEEGKDSKSLKNNFIKRHVNLYCSQKINAESIGICKGRNIKDEDRRAYIGHANLKLSTLLSPSSFKQIAFSDFYAQEYLRYLITPSIMSGVTSMLTPDKDDKIPLYDSAEDQGDFEKNLKSQIIPNVARHSFNTMYSIRMPANQIPNGKGDKSLLQIMEENTSDLIAKPEYLKQINAEIDPAKLLQQQIKLQATQLWMEYHRYRQQERIEALLATQILNVAANSFG